MEIWRNLKVWQKTSLIVGILAIVAIITAIIIINVSSEPKVKIEFADKQDIPAKELREIREYLVNVIESNTEKTSNSITYVGKARDYNEEVVDDFTTATFIVDFDEIKQSYKVMVTWPDPNDGSPNIYISCPLSETKYPGTPCTTETNDSSDLANYLPHSGTLGSGEKYTVEDSYDDGELYIEVKVNSCGNETILNEALSQAKEWMLSINIDPDNYRIYVPGNICGDKPLSSAPYIQANHAKTADKNVNAHLPYYVPNTYFVYPVVDDNDNVTSIRAKIPGCFEYQREPGVTHVMEYLNSAGINYPVEFLECAE